MLKNTKLYAFLRYCYHYLKYVDRKIKYRLQDNPHTTKKVCIAEDTQYMFDIFEGYARSYKNYTGNTLSGKTVLDIGPGISLAVSLMMKDTGANTVYAVEPFLPNYKQKYHGALYQAIIDRLKSTLSNAATDSLEYCISHSTHIAKGIIFHRCCLENMNEIPSSCLDIAFSNATLEHITDPATAFKELARITVPGGYGLHQVDYRYHLDTPHPLDFLLLAGEEQKRFLWTKDGFAHGNGWRHSEYVELFKQSGFEVILAEPNMFADDSYMQEFLPKLRASNSPHKGWPEEDLRILSAYYVIQKN